MKEGEDFDSCRGLVDKKEPQHQREDNPSDGIGNSGADIIDVRIQVSL